MRRNTLAATSSQQPFTRVERLHDEIDHVFSMMVGETSLTPFSSPLLKGLRSERSALDLNMDVTETDKCYEVCAELPGLCEKDVKITYDDGVLTLSGEKSENKEDKNKNFHVFERSFGKFKRQVKLPTNINDTKIEAKFKDGILRIAFPKTSASQVQSREISISK